MPKASLADHSLEWGHLAERVRENAEELPELLAMSIELESLVARAKEIDTTRARLDAERQQGDRHP